MVELIHNIKIQVNDKIFLKDPYSSELGQKILKDSLLLIDEMGFEEFTFKKLASKIGTTESSIYRYFSNKHRLLLYLMSWYWGWLEYKLVFAIANINDTDEKLRSAISVLCSELEDIEINGIISLKILERIAYSESAKSYLTKEIDSDNKEGFFTSYKKLCKRVSNICLEINPDYKYSNTLVSTIFAGIQNQKYFADHLKSLTDFNSNNKDTIDDFFTKLAFDNIKNS